jgi:glycosyltransferase involved in cell wall biosynthesis
MTGFSANKKSENNNASNGSDSTINLVIMGSSNFPRGSAGTSRIRAYAKGLLDIGSHVTVICVRPNGFKRLGDAQIDATGTISGIDYIYSSGRTLCPESLPLRILYELKGIMCSFSVLRTLNRARKINALMYYGYDTLLGMLFAFWAHCMGVSIIEEKCEFQFLNRTIIKKKLKAFIYEKVVVPLFDGMIIMTRSLENYYVPLMKKKSKYLKVPILVDAARFENVAPANIDGPYIAYCGDPTGNKDGVPILIEAFSLIAQKHPDVKLYIIGDSHRKDVLAGLREKAKKLNIGKRVVFTGKVSPDEMPKYLCNAAVLALARPTSVQAQYGFPTKLGEYLATGKPVVVTDVGEITEFLRDGENAYVAQPNSAEAFAIKLDYVLANYENAKQIGLKGKEVAVRNFDYHIHGKRIVEFIRTLKS